MIQDNDLPINGGKFVPDKLFENKKIWTVTDTAAFLDRSVGTIYNLVSLGKLPYYKRGKRLYFRPQEILNWIMEGN